MSTNLPMVHVSDLDNHDTVSDGDYIVLGQGIDAKKITVAELKQALGINNLKTVYKDHAILPTVPANAFRTYTIINDANAYANANGLTGYKLIGAIVNSGGYGDQWQVTSSIYNSTLMVQIKSYYAAELTKAVSCYSVWAKL